MRADAPKDEGSGIYVKIIPIAISVIALIVSFLSWSDSHRNAAINEEINRPILVLADLEPKMLLTSNPSNQIIEFYPILRNTGRSTARMEIVEVYGFLSNAAASCSGKVDDEVGRLANKGIPTIIPSTQEKFLGRTYLSGECSKPDLLSFTVFVNVTYSNETTQKQYQQYFSKDLNLSFAKLKQQVERKQ